MLLQLSAWDAAAVTLFMYLVTWTSCYDITLYKRMKRFCLVQHLNDAMVTDRVVAMVWLS